MTNTILADVSAWQGNINWPAYVAAVRKLSADGKARAIMRASQGVGLKDADFERNWSGALAAGCDIIGVYHYAYPGLHGGTAGAYQEAEYFASVVGSRLRVNDFFMLDLEEAAGTAQWAGDFLFHLASQTGTRPRLYASLNYIETKLQDEQLAAYPLILADWTFSPNSRPAAPKPWTSYEYLQFSDKFTLPGIPGAVDADVYIGGEPLVSSHKTQQAADVWGKAYPTDTGIYVAWLAAYEKGVVCGPPLGPEFATVDWSGNPIRRQEFAHAWIEFYVHGAPGQPAGSHHGYAALGDGGAMVRLW